MFIINRKFFHPCHIIILLIFLLKKNYVNKFEKISTFARTRISSKLSTLASI